MSNNFTIKQVIDIVDKTIEMENKFDCSKVDLMHTIIVQNERIDKAIEYNKSILQESWYGGNEKEYAKTNLEILGDKENEYTRNCK